MKKLLTPGVIVGALTLASYVANAYGYPALGAVLTDPSFAEAATQVLNGVGILVAGMLSGVKPAAA